jgi:hypothetical protein
VLTHEDRIAQNVGRIPLGRVNMATYDATWRPPQPPARTGPVSAVLVAKSYQLVVADPTMLGVVFFGGLASALVFAGIAVPVWLWSHVDLTLSTATLPTYLVYGVAGWASAFVGPVFSGAVVAAGVARLDGHPISTTQALTVAAGRWRPLAAWALTTTVVSLFDMATRRFGFVGAIARLITDVAWALATMLVLPVILVEGRMPVAAIRESAELVRGQLGITLRTKIRFYVPWLVASVISALLTVGGIVAFVRYQHETASWAAAGLIVAALGVLLFFGTISVQNAADAYLNTLLYRHALGQPVPDVDPRDLPRLAGPAEPLRPGWSPGGTL